MVGCGNDECADKWLWYSLVGNIILAQPPGDERFCKLRVQPRSPELGILNRAVYPGVYAGVDTCDWLCYNTSIDSCVCALLDVSSTLKALPAFWCISYHSCLFSL